LNLKKGGSIPEVESVWNAIINNASLLKTKYGKRFDGLNYWNSIKPFLKDIDSRKHEPIQWNPNHQNVINNFRHIRSEIPEKDSLNKLIEKNHFLLQQLNIPGKDEGVATFRRLMQIALNIGQLQPYLHSFSDKVQKLITTNNLSNIKTYMTNDNYNNFIFDKADLLKLMRILEKNIKKPLLKEI